MPRPPPMHIFQVARGTSTIRLSLIGKLMSAAAAARAMSCIPHPLEITESNKRETTQVSAQGNHRFGVREVVRPNSVGQIPDTEELAYDAGPWGVRWPAR